MNKMDYSQGVYQWEFEFLLKVFLGKIITERNCRKNQISEKYFHLTFQVLQKFNRKPTKQNVGLWASWEASSNLKSAWKLFFSPCSQVSTPKMSDFGSKINQLFKFFKSSTVMNKSNTVGFEDRMKRVSTWNQLQSYFLSHFESREKYIFSSFQTYFPEICEKSRKNQSTFFQLLFSLTTQPKVDMQ